MGDVKTREKKGGMMSKAETATSLQAYNYESFSRSESTNMSGEFKRRMRAGEEAPDFELPTLDGQRIRLSSFRDKKHVLLEFGSIT